MAVELTKQAWTTAADHYVEVDKINDTIVASNGFNDINFATVESAREFIEALTLAIAFYEGN